ncbi:MAG TPA: lipid-binding SYLF domain-containing protein [Pyrinomonadaceae bacterium]|nr:lipid-binding SYLF domain-containing protein [Pyrinomonadaceae bacterium]
MRATKIMALLVIAFVATFGLWVSTSTARTKDDADTTKRLNASAGVLSEIMAAPDKGIPQDLLDKSACVVIVPNVKKGAFIVGAKYGRGFVVCRNQNGRGWSAPAGVKIEGGSVGFQIGGSETDVVMLLMNQSAIDKLLSSKFTIGGDASVAAGPVGRTSSAATDAQLHAELLSYSRARGLFAGVSLDGATLRPDDDANKDMYGKAMSNKDVVRGNIKPPRAADRLIAELNKHSSRRAGG